VVGDAPKIIGYDLTIGGCRLFVGGWRFSPVGAYLLSVGDDLALARRQPEETQSDSGLVICDSSPAQGQSSEVRHAPKRNGTGYLEGLFPLPRKAGDLATVSNALTFTCRPRSGPSPATGC
jgi:hypothetical protein